MTVRHQFGMILSSEESREVGNVKVLSIETGTSEQIVKT